MRIGLCGAHRTGKSTLMNLFAKEQCITPLPSSLFPVAKSMGLDMSKPHSFTTRLCYQTVVLDAMERVYSSAPSFVSDRTPLDAAAYLLADVQTTTGNAELQDLTNQYVDRAICLTNRLFDIVILVPPAITVEPVDGKPPVNPAYQEHIHFLIAGLTNDLTVPNGSIARDNLDLEDRMDAITVFVTEQNARIARDYCDAKVAA